MKPLPLSFFRRPTAVVARDLIGATILAGSGPRRTGGRIVEVEAYLGIDDPASHAYRGRRHAGNLHLYSAAGTWYVYRSYGLHWCANLVAGEIRNGGAVLLRAIRPEHGIPLMRRRRGRSDSQLANGPGKLTQALGITVTLDGVAMRDSNVLIYAGPGPSVVSVEATPRVGITKAADWPFRFVELPGS